MPRALMVGAASLRLNMSYNALYKAARKYSDLPGLFRLGRLIGFEESKVDELRAALVEKGVIREPQPAAVA